MVSTNQSLIASMRGTGEVTSETEIVSYFVRFLGGLSLDVRALTSLLANERLWVAVDSEGVAVDLQSVDLFSVAVVSTGVCSGLLISYDEDAVAAFFDACSDFFSVFESAALVVSFSACG